MDYHDFETHRQLAINSGIQNQREWIECYKRIYARWNLS